MGSANRSISPNVRILKKGIKTRTPLSEILCHAVDPVERRDSWGYLEHWSPRLVRMCLRCATAVAHLEGDVASLLRQTGDPPNLLFS